MWAPTIPTLKRGVVARSASYPTSVCGTCVSPSRMGGCTPSAHGLTCVSVVVVTKGVAVEALGMGIEPQATLGPIC